MKENRETAMKQTGLAHGLFGVGRAVRCVPFFVMQNLTGTTWELLKVPPPVALLLRNNPQVGTVPAHG